MATWGKTSIKDSTYEIIKSKILHEEYKMGEPLNLTQLEKELGISNTPIREAISALVSEGLLVSFHNSRVHVVTFKDKEGYLAYDKAPSHNEARVYIHQHVQESHTVDFEY